MRTIILIVYATLCSVFAGAPASAKIYQWVDKNGVRHFSETPTRLQHRDGFLALK
jgi:hypothetical protein